MTKQDGGVENPKEAAGRTKVQLQLVPPAAMHEMALALECGALKYGAWNWRAAGINLMTYLGAMRRHIDAILDGEDRDKESGVSHIGHVLAGAAICCDAASVEMLRDDRPGRPASARERALARLNEMQDRAAKLRAQMVAAEPDIRIPIIRNLRDAALAAGLTENRVDEMLRQVRDEAVEDYMRSERYDGEPEHTDWSDRFADREDHLTAPEGSA